MTTHLKAKLTASPRTGSQAGRANARRSTLSGRLQQAGPKALFQYRTAAMRALSESRVGYAP